MKCKAVAILILFLGVCTCPLLAAQIRYAFTDLGTIGGSSSFASGINDAGTVVGASTTVGGVQHAFAYENGVMRDLGRSIAGESQAVAINNRGQILINSVHGNNAPAFLLTAGNYLNLGFSSFGGKDINDLGQVVGIGDGVMGGGGYLWSEGTQTLLKVASIGETAISAIGINNHGQIVGRFGGLGGSKFPIYHDFVYENGSGRDLGVSIIPTAINDQGTIIGGLSGAMIYADGQPKPLNGLSALAINDLGQIVGTVFTGGASHAAIFENGKAIDLNPLVTPHPGRTLQEAFGINNSGQIVGSALTPEGNLRAFLLTPIPEPAAFSIFLLAVPALLRRRHLRQQDEFASVPPA